MVAPDTRTVTVTPPALADGEPRPVEIPGELPVRVRLELQRVHQDLAEELEAAPGAWEPDAFRASAFAQLPQNVKLESVAAEL